ncbi:MAG TPA: ROK family transcriptional regulator [Verrucomicrobiae bacterium]|jgi:predicted NBD/HSP70 family sugar kinase
MILIPSQMGRHNKRALLEHLRRTGTASRAGLAKSLGLSQPTVGKIADELLELGVFEEMERFPAARTKSRVGRPARMLHLNRSKVRFLGLQLGVETTRLVLLPLGATEEVEYAAQFKTPDNAKSWTHQLRNAAAGIPQKSFWGVLVSVPGLVDERSGDILYSPNVHWTEKIDIASLIQNIWRAPVLLIQEERALALGQYAVEPDDGDFLLIDFAEGVGGAIMVGGKLYTHPLPISGELGHTPVSGNDRRCGCGAVGCLETLTSTRGLLKSFAAASPKSPRTWEAFSQSIASNDVAPWLAQTLDATAAVIAGALNVLGIRSVVITGSPAELPTPVFTHLSAAIVKGALWARFGDIKIRTAPRRRYTGLVAAGLDRLVVPMDHTEEKFH